jgi:hypothetical protein
MVIEISPRSLFGRHSYVGEQRLILALTKEIDETVALVSPHTVVMPLPLQRLPAEYRRGKIKEHLTRAKAILETMGV